MYKLRRHVRVGGHRRRYSNVYVSSLKCLTCQGWSQNSGNVVCGCSPRYLKKNTRSFMQENLIPNKKFTRGQLYWRVKDGGTFGWVHLVI